VTHRLVPVAALAIALLCGVGYAGYVGYDSTFALIWGRELAGGEAPSFEGAFSPAPHPLLNVVGALLSPLGADAAAQAMELLALAGLVLLGYGGYRLGGALFSPVAGVVLAAILVTRPAIVELALFAQFDVPFLALVVLAAALVAEGRRVAPLALLALAGLLRPEAWLLAGALAVFEAAREGRAEAAAERRAVGRPARRVAPFALAAAAPLLWVLHDLVLTGDPLFSLHTTGDFAERHQTGVTVADAPDLIADVTGIVVALAGAAAWVLIRAEEQRRAILPAVLFGLAVVPFLAYGALGLELYARFLLPAAAALAALAAAAATGWARDKTQPLFVAALLASAPFTIADLADVREKSAERARLERDLQQLAEENRAELDRCPIIVAPSFRVVPPLMHRLDLPGERFTDREAGAASLHIAVEGDRDHVVEQLEPDPVRTPDRRPPPGARPVAETADWRLSSSC
jgi:hypothetical protein